jgi:hypothetical protein
VLAQDRRRELHQLAANDGETGLLEPIEDVADMPLLHAIGLKNNEGFLHKSATIQFAPRLESLIFR